MPRVLCIFCAARSGRIRRGFWIHNLRCVIVIIANVNVVGDEMWVVLQWVSLPAVHNPLVFHDTCGNLIQTDLPG